MNIVRTLNLLVVWALEALIGHGYVGRWLPPMHARIFKMAVNCVYFLFDALCWGSGRGRCLSEFELDFGNFRWL